MHINGMCIQMSVFYTYFRTLLFYVELYKPSQVVKNYPGSLCLQIVCLKRQLASLERYLFLRRRLRWNRRPEFNVLTLSQIESLQRGGALGSKDRKAVNEETVQQVKKGRNRK